MTSHPGDFAQAADKDVLRYSQVWEDHLLLEQGLAIAPGDEVLSICSAGCNALAMLLAGAERVVAVDLNRAQTSLMELKLAGFRRLTHEELAVLLGARDGADRLALYEKVRPALPARARDHWDAHEAELRAGVIHCGRLERYFQAFRERFFPPAAIDALLSARTPAAQREAFGALVTPEVKAAFAKYFGREGLASGGRDPSQFKYVGEMDVGAWFLDRFRWACAELPVPGNFYLEYALTGRYRDLEAGPPYLRPSAFARLASLTDRVTVVEAELGEYLAGQPRGAFSKMNLSDLFEYLSPETTGALMSALIDRLRPGGRLAFWTLLVPREAPPELRARLRSHRDLGEELWRRDRAWFYGSFQLEEAL